MLRGMFSTLVQPVMSRRTISRWVALGCALAAHNVAWAEAELAPTTALETITQEVRAIFERSLKAVVQIEAMDDHGALLGTGFFIDPNGTLFTAYTIGGESREITVRTGGQRYPARRLVADPRSGVAILKVDTQTPFLTVGKSRDLAVASPVVSIGYPMDLPVTPSFGTIGGFDLRYLGQNFATTHIRANVPVQRGEGGAPLMNIHGEVIGILISSLDSGSACFALPIEAAEKVRRDFIRFGEVRPGAMGVNVGILQKPVGGSEAKVKVVFEGGAAQKAGIEPGDVLLKIGSRPIRVIEDVVDAVFYMTAEEALTVKVQRNEQTIDLSLVPGDHAASGHADTGNGPLRPIQALPGAR